MIKGIFFLLLLINVILGLALEEFLYTNDLLFESLKGHEIITVRFVPL